MTAEERLKRLELAVGFLLGQSFQLNPHRLPLELRCLMSEPGAHRYGAASNASMDRRDVAV